MAKKTVRDLGDAELIDELAEEKDRLFKLRFQLATGQLENSARIQETKKDIARINTELRAREIAAAEAQPEVRRDERRQLRRRPSATCPRRCARAIVTSNKMDRTAVVTVTERVRHTRYNKTLQRDKKLYVHDEANDLNIGDRVRVAETRPLSKLKRWRIVEVLERAR